jgi:hypothetical protein
LIDERVDGTQIYSYFVLEKFLDELHDVPPPRVEGKQEAGDLSFERQLVCPNERSVHRWGMSWKYESFIEALLPDAYDICAR